MQEVTILHIQLSKNELKDLVESSVRKVIGDSGVVDAKHEETWFDLDELVKYDPEKRKKATFYGYVNYRTIPFHKPGKKLLFLKSEIDLWLKKGKRNYISELGAEATQFLKIK